MFYLILALVEEGDEVLYPNPGFPIYESMINFAGGKPVPLPLLEKFEFRFDVNELRQRVNDRTKLIIINSPQNPTGGLLTKSDLEAIAQIAVERDIMVLSDEIYARIIYDGAHNSIHSPARNAGTNRDPRWLLQDLCNDGLAPRLRGYAPRLAGAHFAAGDEQRFSCTAPFTQIAGLEALANAERDVSRDGSGVPAAPGFHL